mgnify:CR=1 FL=1
MPAYSNYATGVAGYIVERVSGRAVRRLRRPAHLRAARHGTLLVPPAAAEGARWPAWRRATRTRIRQAEEATSSSTLAPAGALSSATGADMAQFHDRAPAERRVRRPAHPLRGNGEEDARHAADDHPERQPHGARVLSRRAPTATASSPTAATRSTSTATCTCFVDDGRRLLHLVQQRRQGRRRAAQLREAFYRSFADRYFPGPRSRRRGRRGDCEGARRRDRGQLHQLAPCRNELPQRASTCCSPRKSSSTKTARFRRRC